MARADVNFADVIKLLFLNCFPAPTGPTAATGPAAMAANLRRTFGPNHSRSSSVDTGPAGQYATVSMTAPAARTAATDIANELSTPPAQTAGGRGSVVAGDSSGTGATASRPTVRASSDEYVVVQGASNDLLHPHESLSPPTSHDDSPAPSPPLSRTTSLQGQPAPDSELGMLYSGSAANLQLRQGLAAITETVPLQPAAGGVSMGAAQAEAFTRPRSNSMALSAFLPASPTLTVSQMNAQLSRASAEAIMLVAATAPDAFVRILSSEKLPSRLPHDRTSALRLISLIARKVG